MARCFFHRRPLIQFRIPVPVRWCPIVKYPRKDGSDSQSDRIGPIAHPIGFYLIGRSSARHCSSSHDALIPVYDAAGNVIETHKPKGELKQW